MESVSFIKMLVKAIYFVAFILIQIGNATIFIFGIIPKFILRILKVLFWPNIKLEKKKKAIERRAKSKVIFDHSLKKRVRLRFFIEGAVFSLVFIFIPLLILISLQSLPRPENLDLRFIPKTTKIYDRNSTLLYQIYANENRTIVPLSEIPKDLQNATIAIEDKDFYKHPGFDITAIVRSFIENLSGKGLQGGSTITQQLIKSALLTPEASISRKIKEVILAFWAERIYNKSQILEMYFNQIPYGGTAWGVEAASEIYFGKKVHELDLAQSAFLAGIPKAPTLFSPFGEDNSLWKKRQKDVLDRMVVLGYITKDEANKAEAEELEFQSQEIPILAPHFVMYLKNLLIEKYGLPLVEKGGLTVVTSLDLKIQEKAQTIVRNEVAKNAYLNLTNGAVLVTTPRNGDILAMVGSQDYSNPNGGNVNVTTSLRQPGSSIKAVTYAAAFAKGFTAATILDDSQVTFTMAGSSAYSPVNYDGKFHGKVPLRIAFANSFNVPAVKTLNQIGVKTMLDLGKKMGIDSWSNESQYGLSLTLGGGDVTMVEMATVYGVLANLGIRVNLNPIIKVIDYQGNILEEKRVTEKKVIDDGIAFIISDILADNQARAWEFGANSPLNIAGQKVSVKTGTSDNKRDNWTIGYTSEYLTAVWVGNNDNSPMSQDLASGITGAAPIWNQIMTGLLTNSSGLRFKMPVNVVQKDCLGRKEYFIKGTENSVSCNPLPTWTPTPNP